MDETGHGTVGPGCAGEPVFRPGAADRGTRVSQQRRAFDDYFQVNYTGTGRILQQKIAGRAAAPRGRERRLPHERRDGMRPRGGLFLRRG